MNVNELIENLKKMPPEMEVFITDADMVTIGCPRAIYMIDSDDTDRQPCSIQDAESVVILIEGHFEDLIS